MYVNFNPTLPLQQQLALLLPNAWPSQPDLIPRDPARYFFPLLIPDNLDINIMIIEVLVKYKYLNAVYISVHSTRWGNVNNIVVRSNASGVHTQTLAKDTLKR